MSKPHSLPLIVAVVLLGAAFVAPPATAFTFEDGKGNTVPKFDLDEQARQFRSKPDLDVSTGDKKGLATPFGSLQLGVDRNRSAFGSSPFGSPMFGGVSDANRQHYDRMFSHENLQGR